MAYEQTFRDIQVTSRQIHVRKVGLGDLVEALKQGYSDFTTRPTQGLFVAILYPLFALLFSLSLAEDSLVYLAFPIVAGLTLLGPVLSIALCEMSRRRELGLSMSWSSSFAFIHSHTFAPIAALSILLILLYVGWLYAAEYIYLSLFGDMTSASLQQLADEILTTRRGGALLFYGSAVGFIFAILALVISVVAIPLLLDKPATAPTAIRVSLAAAITNPVAVGAWGLIVATLLALGAATFLIGLAVVLPVLGHATWHLYRKLVEP